MKINIDVGKIVDIQEGNITDGINKVLIVAKNSIDEKTPEDIGRLIENNKIKPAKREGTKIVGKVVNDTEYAYYVENGVSGKRYNYYKNGLRRRGGSPFYTGEGARMFVRTADELRFKIKNIIKGR